MVTAELFHDEMPDESRGAGVNQMFDLNLVAEPDCNLSLEGAMRSQSAEDDDLQGKSIEISGCFIQPSSHSVAKKVHSTGELPAINGHSEVVTSICYVNKKRKCSSENGETVLPEESLLSVGHAKSYLIHLAKKRCYYGNGSAVSVGVSEGASQSAQNFKEYGFHMKIDEDDAEDMADGALFRSYFTESFGVDVVGSSGGLWVGWKGKSMVHLVTKCNNFIILMINKYATSPWYLILFYGEPNTSLRMNVFDQLGSLIETLTYPYLILGDFNQVEFNCDKLSRNKGQINGAMNFSKWRITHELIDIPYKGPRFTWCNNRKGIHRVYERIDKGLGSKDWQHLFPNSAIRHYPIQISDHAPIELDLHLTKLKSSRPQGWRFGPNSNLNISTTRWINGARPTFITVLDVSTTHSVVQMTIKDLILPTMKWNYDLIYELFETDWARKISVIPICPSIIEDTVVWVLTSTGNYSVKSGYTSALKVHLDTSRSIKDANRISHTAKVFCKRKLWFLPIPPTWKVLIWKIMTNSLPMREEFLKRRIQIDPVCPFCNYEGSVETTAHLFCDCEISKRIWAASTLGITTGYDTHVPIDIWIINWYRFFFSSKANQSTIISFSSILWSIWIIRMRVLVAKVSTGGGCRSNKADMVAVAAVDSGKCDDGSGGKGDLQGAEEYYFRASQANPGDGESLAQCAQLVWVLHHDHERALAYFDLAAQTAPDDSFVMAAYAKFLWETEDDEEDLSAVPDTFQKSAHLQPTDGINVDSGDLESYYKRMINDKPSDPTFLKKYAQFLYESKGDLEDAEEYYSRAVLVEPQDGEMLSQFATLLWELYHDRERTLSYLERAIEAAPQDCNVFAAYARILWTLDE
ncbi:hypothetical protein KSS87_008704 [Heliosperma pusillum]|nr:hypothetical protein KSS87_008704 [Heliosperma pusillum]